MKPRCFFGVVAAIALLLAGASFILTAGLGRGVAMFTLLPPQQVDFRPAKKPGPEQGWAQSRLALTVIPVQYSNDGGKQVRILNETVTLEIKDRSVPFKWHNEVEMKANCGSEWLCTKGSVGTDTLQRDGTLRRETMFMPAKENLTWLDFLDAICLSKEDRLNVTITGEARTSSIFGSAMQKRTAVCQIDLKAMRESLESLDCRTGLKKIPVRLSPACINR